MDPLENFFQNMRISILAKFLVYKLVRERKERLRLQPRGVSLPKIFLFLLVYVHREFDARVAKPK